MKKTHFLIDDKPACGQVKTIQDTKSIAWFTSIKHKCKSCDKINSIKSTVSLQ